MAYSSALSTNNLRSAFRRTGISPFKPDVVSSDQMAPSKVYSSNCQISSNENECSLQPFFDKEVEVIKNKQNHEKQKK